MFKRFLATFFVLYSISCGAGLPNNYLSSRLSIEHYATHAHRFSTIVDENRIVDVRVFDEILRELKDISTQLGQDMVRYDESNDRAQQLAQLSDRFNYYYDRIDGLRWVLIWKNGVAHPYASSGQDQDL